MNVAPDGQGLTTYEQWNWTPTPTQGVQTREKKEDTINISRRLQRTWEPTQQPTMLHNSPLYELVMNMMERMLSIWMTSDVMMTSGDGVQYQ